MDMISLAEVPASRAVDSRAKGSSRGQHMSTPWACRLVTYVIVLSVFEHVRFAPRDERKQEAPNPRSRKY